LEPCQRQPPLEVAEIGKLILHPPGLLAKLEADIGARESRDVMKNIQTLDAVAEAAAPITPTAAAKV
jgi:hypothetical protein